MKRDSIPTEIKRAVLVEAGHRCAIPTCRATTTEIAHIIPWETVREHRFENLIALCPNCHTRFDQKKDIDRKAIRMYKQNLGLLNRRYGDFEMRLFSMLARSGQTVFVTGAGAEIHLAHAVLDGLLEVVPSNNEGFGTDATIDGVEQVLYLPATAVYKVTDVGKQFLKSFAEGEPLT